MTELVDIQTKVGKHGGDRWYSMEDQERKLYVAIRDTNANNMTRDQLWVWNSKHGFWRKTVFLSKLMISFSLKVKKKNDVNKLSKKTNPNNMFQLEVITCGLALILNDLSF